MDFLLCVFAILSIRDIALGETTEFAIMRRFLSFHDFARHEEKGEFIIFENVPTLGRLQTR